ncbi:MAG TPA: molybdopterin-dependent oxidoreductase, partial [Candidatus Dormibacteraeota bacterium]|nr:molybdopterin-dependent oxidoreductase [Candidatus Dormibacteraeota bacterium]
NAAEDLAGAPILVAPVPPASAVAVAGEPSAEPVPAVERLGGRVTRRMLLGAGLAAGAALGAGASGWPSQRLGWLLPVHPGDAPLDFPVMNYEGGMQQVDVTAWRLRVTGTVGTRLELTEADLLAMPFEEHRYAINCVTGWTATRTWRGVPVAAVLERAGVDPEWGHADVRSTSGYHWDHRRADLTHRGALLCTHIDGVRLDDAHGYPVRLIVPGIVGKANIKWIDGLAVGPGGPQLYLGPHVDFSNPTVTGPLLPRDPAGRRP